MDTVKLHTVEAAINRIKKDQAGSPMNVGNVDLTLEFVLASFFPEAWKNYQELLNETAAQNFKHGYDEGYADGQKSQTNLYTEDL